MKFAALASALVVLLGARATAQGPAPSAIPPNKDYLVVVGSEGDDRIAVVRFGPGACLAAAAGGDRGARGVAAGACARVEREHRMGTNPTELVGPHGVGVSPDGRYYYVSTAHGTPYGSLWKYTAAGDTLVGRVQLGAFPATLQVSPDGAFVYVVNFNLHGDMVPSSVSVVLADGMTEVARIPTCTMPHGSRLNAQGTKHYSVCMMDDMLVEIDARTLTASRSFLLTRGSEHGMPGGPQTHLADLRRAGEHQHPAPATSAGAPSSACSPTWAQPSPDGGKLYVACNKTNDLVEVNVAGWRMTRRIPAGEGVYNLAVTRDGRTLVATNKRGQSVSVIDVATGAERARIATTRKVASGVAISPDDRYAFVTVEGVGSQPGTLEVIDLRALRSVAQVDVGPQAGGVDVLRVENPK